jgi:hypothetical protein
LKKRYNSLGTFFGTLKDSYRLDLTDLNTDERRKEVLTDPFFSDYREVSDKSLLDKGFYEKVNTFRIQML